MRFGGLVSREAASCEAPRDEDCCCGSGRFLLGGGGLFEHPHDVGLLHDQEILAVDLHLGARPLAEQHPVADLQINGNELAGLVAATRADADDLALRGLFLGGIRNDDAAGGLFFGLNALDDDTVVKRAELHGISSSKATGMDRWNAAARGTPLSRLVAT